MHKIKKVSTSKFIILPTNHLSTKLEKHLSIPDTKIITPTFKSVKELVSKEHRINKMYQMLVYIKLSASNAIRNI